MFGEISHQTGVRLATCVFDRFLVKHVCVWRDCLFGFGPGWLLFGLGLIWIGLGLLWVGFDFDWGCFGL